MTLHTEQDAARQVASHGEPRKSQLNEVRLDPAHALLDANSISCDAAHANVVEGCAGCQALAKRVEQLEQKLAAIAIRSIPFPESPLLGTKGCYWLIIAIHCVLFGIASLGLESLGIVLYPLLVGAIGSLVVCHVLANPAKTIVSQSAF